MQRDRQQLTSAWQRIVPAFAQQALAGSPGPTVYYNASVWTGDVQAPLAEAFACNATGHLSAIGSSAAMLALAGSQSQLVNLQGSFVTPGLIDAHVHMLFGGSTLQQIDLRNVRSKEDFAAAVQQAVDSAAPGQWLLGHGWTEGSWGGALPSITWVDHVTPNNPLLLSRSDMHMALVNSAALRLANLSPETESPPGGRIDKDDEGKLSGILADHAMTLVTKHIPKQMRQDKRRALQTAAKHLLSKGVTTVCDMGSVQDADDTGPPDDC